MRWPPPATSLGCWRGDGGPRAFTMSHHLPLGEAEAAEPGAGGAPARGQGGKSRIASTCRVLVDQLVLVV